MAGSQGSPHQTSPQDIQQMVDKLEARLRSNPSDLDGWLMLGRSYTATERFARAADAYEQAYKISDGNNIDAITGLGEALAMNDQASLVSGRAAQLFEQALAKAPSDSKALWYGGISALQSGKLNVARDRLQLLLAQDPPPQIRTLLERQVQDLNSQLGNNVTPPTVAPVKDALPAPAGARVIKVSISITPELLSKIPGPTPLFVLARDPAGGGPPLAVQKRSSAELPLTVELNEQSAMVPGRSIANTQRVQVVARISRSGAPVGQSGDFFGEAEYDFSKGASGSVKIVIDRTIP
jgi:cytochrome c-type biogenesis protein CcmH